MVGRAQKGRQQRDKAGLYPAEGEATGTQPMLHGKSAAAPAPALEHDVERVEVTPTPPNEGKAWLLGKLTECGAEKPRAHLNKHGVWYCGDGPRKLGTVTNVELEARDEGAILRLFQMMLAVKVKIIAGDFNALWGAALCAKYVKQKVLLDLMRGGAPEDVPAMTWVSRRAMSLSGEWREEMEARAKRGDQRAGVNAKVLLGSSTLVFAATRTLSDYARWKSRQSSDHGPPWATSLTFDVKGSDLKLWLDDEGGLHCRMALLGMSNGHRQEQPEFVLHPDGGSAWANVRAILGGEYEQRSAKVERTARGDWMLGIAYRRPRPVTMQGQGSLIVLRSMQRFLVAVGSDGRLPRKKLDAANLLRVKQEFQARKHTASEHVEHQGQGARGHGRARFFRILTWQQDAEARYTQTWCQQQAAFIAKQATEMGYGAILLETFEGGVEVAGERRFERLLRRFPFDKLRQCIMHAGLKVGLPVRPFAGARGKCPKCGTKMYADGFLLRCSDAACGVAGEAETLAAWHGCLAAGEDAAALEGRTLREVERWKKVTKLRECEHLIPEAAEAVVV